MSGMTARLRADCGGRCRRHFATGQSERLLRCTNDATYASPDRRRPGLFGRRPAAAGPGEPRRGEPGIAGGAAQRAHLGPGGGLFLRGVRAPRLPHAAGRTGGGPLHGLGGSGRSFIATWQDVAAEHGVLLVAPTLAYNAQLEPLVPTLLRAIVAQVKKPRPAGRPHASGGRS